MVFTNPQAFWLLGAVPVLAVSALVLHLWTKRDRRRFADPSLYGILSGSTSASRRRLGSVAYLFGIGFLALAMTGPRFGTRTEIVQRLSVDIVIVLDTSYSMLAEDIKPNRIQQAKYEIYRLIDNLQGDRVALIAFSGNAVIQCPLTTDYGAAKMFLDNIDVGVVPSQGTNIEEAIDSALLLFESNSSMESQSRMIIMVTDGESLEGDPERAAKRAVLRDTRIFTVGIGTSDGDIIPIRNQAGELYDYKRDKDGVVVITSLDEQALNNIASITRGTYLRSENGEVDIQAIIDELGTMHHSDIHERRISRLRERFQIPLGGALVFFMVWLTIGERRSSPVSRTNPPRRGGQS
ncbi:VWA domain-containing protein [Candidatus Latescibacterota bacterium]